MSKEIGDNLGLMVRAKTRETFEMAMRIAFQYESKAVAYAVDYKHGMILYWSKPTNSVFNAQPLPYAMNVDQVINFVWGWLESLWENYDEYKKFIMPDGGENVDHDGHNEKGFQVYNSNWGNIGNDWYSFVAISPAYIWIGK
jgi:hypothetical protein